MGGWEREHEFQDLLARCTKKPSSKSMEKLVDIAVTDEKWCYKHVSGLLVKYGSKSKPNVRINVLYCLSAILRRSKAKLGKKDLYVSRLQPSMMEFANNLAGAPAQHMAQVAKVVSSWRKDDLFSADILAVFDKLAEKVQDNQKHPPLPAHGSPVTGAGSDISLPSAGSLVGDDLHHASRPAEANRGAVAHAEVSSQPWPSMHHNIVVPGQLPPPPPVPPQGWQATLAHVPAQDLNRAQVTPKSEQSRARRRSRWEEMPSPPQHSHATPPAAAGVSNLEDHAMTDAQETPRVYTTAAAPPLPEPAEPPPPLPSAPADQANGPLQLGGDDADKQRRIAEVLAISRGAAAQQSQSQPPAQPPPAWPMHQAHLQPQPPSQPPPSWGMPPPMHIPLAPPPLPQPAVPHGGWYQHQPYIPPPAPPSMWPAPAVPAYSAQYDWGQGQWSQPAQQVVPGPAPPPLLQGIPPPAPPRAPPPHLAEPLGPPPPPPPSPPPAPAGSPPASTPEAWKAEVKAEALEGEPEDESPPGVEKGDDGEGASGGGDRKSPDAASTWQAEAIGSVEGVALLGATSSKAGTDTGASVSVPVEKIGFPVSPPGPEELVSASKPDNEEGDKGRASDGDVTQEWVVLPAQSNGLNGLGHEGVETMTESPSIPYAEKLLEAAGKVKDMDGMPSAGLPVLPAHDDTELA